MALFNYATKEITLKIVYYGPGLSGKTTNLQYLHSILNPETKGRLLSLSTEADRTLFFDFLPVELGKIRDFSIRFQLYTVPGQVRYNATRKIVLKGADAVIFVADSQRDMKEQNIDSFENMRENLFSNNINPDEIPVIFQYNKRDLNNVASIEELNAELNPYGYRVVEACAINGSGVEESFKLITKLLLKFIAKKHQIEIQQPEKKEEEKSVEKPEAVVDKLPPLPAFSVSPEVQTEVSLPEKAIIPDSRVVSGEGAVLSSEEDLESGYGRILEQEKILSPRPEEIPVLPVDKVDQIAEELTGLHGILTDIKNSLYVLSKEMKDLRSIKKEQEETSRSLKDLSARFEGLKTKRRWFRF